jgi:hypothetical protein
VSFDDFSGAGAVVSPSHRSRDLFGSFLDLAKTKPPPTEVGVYSGSVEKQNREGVLLR